VSDSGVFGSTVNLDATGSIIGVIVARNFLGVNALQNVNVSAFSEGDAHISAGESLQGTVFAVGGITAGAGTTVDASLLSQNVTTSGSVSSSSQLGFTTFTGANSTSSSLQSDDTLRRGGLAGDNAEDGDDLKKRGLGKDLPLLTKTTGRVTMILPAIQ
jgi:hypothetical protein